LEVQEEEDALLMKIEQEQTKPKVLLGSKLIVKGLICYWVKLGEDRGLLRAGQDLDGVGHPAYLLPTPRQSLSSEHNI
jgi:hypothetical protein